MDELLKKYRSHIGVYEAADHTPFDGAGFDRTAQLRAAALAVNTSKNRIVQELIAATGCSWTLASNAVDAGDWNSFHDLLNAVRRLMQQDETEESDADEDSSPTESERPNG
ncbi:hypothetical protein J2W25_002123 [Variovorax boronicumulans]|uniref:Uncharacterized protein n=1 Tax=Variovorax boronicumulans TaxID=436515 RepID=A0AAW8DVC7_9BURK|nr:hypothetical protein [Variovorax boronicumulans]MDP9877818.1 hypothetical protein [Variovorax boronicumulans]MDP9923102.1 hypothetical protein [Variovorax boronicumulans]